MRSILPGRTSCPTQTDNKVSRASPTRVIRASSLIVLEVGCTAVVILDIVKTALPLFKSFRLGSRCSKSADCGAEAGQEDREFDHVAEEDVKALGEEFQTS